ncbi:glycosyltransferase family 2 protein [Streptomyces sp. NP160]|uniref:glycosyltransferase family 2 protein n=1 Tax=Streptomyces sp. NP160 TaxID=2586637 RepID=UPI00111928C5|nr:glycosyltransferase [Streptomyces sp. NP160]TNM59449.1 glycosyltransferase family 2 protein [Streptomyces sp. NP160]
MTEPRLQVAVVIATAGRPDVVGDVLADLAAQTVAPDHVVLSVPDERSLPTGGVPDGVLVTRASGVAAQRNAGMRAVPGVDVVLFFDDDSRVRADFVENALAVFESDPSVLALSARVLLDGAVGPAVTVDDALRALAESARDPDPAGGQPVADRKTLYGCGFGYRVGATAERFDERLPLYSWLEDHDLARRLLKQGRLVTAPQCVIVHRGVKSGGRTAHVRLGYSQVMNPSWFVRKGSFPLPLAADEIGRRVVKNAVLSLGGPEAAWRRQRLRGNALAALDVLRGRFTPERILQL